VRVSHLTQTSTRVLCSLQTIQIEDIPCLVSRNHELATKHQVVHIQDTLARSTGLGFWHYLAIGSHARLWKAVQDLRPRIDKNTLCVRTHALDTTYL
jgi:hypothetical protein